MNEQQTKFEALIRDVKELRDDTAERFREASEEVIRNIKDPNFWRESQKTANEIAITLMHIDALISNYRTDIKP